MPRAMGRTIGSFDRMGQALSPVSHLLSLILPEADRVSDR